MKQAHINRGSLFLLLLLVNVGASAYDIGSASGNPITPYSASAQPAREELEQMMQQSAAGRTIQGITSEGKHTFWLKDIGFSYAGGPSTPGQIENTLLGTAEDGTRVELDLCRLQEIVVKKYLSFFFRKRQAIVDVLVFPDIEPEELLSTTPSYSDLQKAHSRWRRIVIDLFDRDGRPYAIVSRTGSAGEGVIPFSSIEPDSRLILGYDYSHPPVPIWWATGSVIADSAYPYRVSFAK